MMVRVFFIIIFLTIASFYSDKPSVKLVSTLDESKLPFVDFKLRPAVVEYLNTMVKLGVDVSRIYKLDSIITVRDKIICGQNSAIGCCDYKIVKIKLVDSLMNNDEAFYIKLLIYHELGHCVLLMRHHEQYVAIMNSIQDKSLTYYKNNWNFLVRDYFNYYEFLQLNPEQLIVVYPEDE